MSQQAAKLKPDYAQLGSKGKYALYPATEEEDLDLPFTYDSLSVIAVKDAYSEECKELGVPYNWNNGGISTDLDYEDE